MDAKKSQIRQEALNVGALPTRPPFDVTGLEPSPHSNCYLTGVEYVDGYPLIAESAFGLAKSLESTWKDASARASSHAYDWAGELWHRVNGLDLTSLYDASDDVPEFCSAGDLHHLRLCYPELSALADGTLFWHFVTYNRGYCYSGHWTARRDDAFLFFWHSGFQIVRAGAIAKRGSQGGRRNSGICFVAWRKRYAGTGVRISLASLQWRHHDVGSGVGRGDTVASTG